MNLFFLFFVKEKKTGVQINFIVGLKDTSPAGGELLVDMLGILVKKKLQ